MHISLTMMTILCTLGLLSCVTAILAILIAIESRIQVIAMQKSTHTIQWQPIPTPEDSIKEEEKVAKEMKKEFRENVVDQYEIF